MRRVPAAGELADVDAVQDEIFVQPGSAEGSTGPAASVSWIPVAKTAAVMLGVLVLAALATWVLVLLDTTA
jgi:hypothetical protein